MCAHTTAPANAFTFARESVADTLVKSSRFYVAGWKYHDLLASFGSLGEAWKNLEEPEALVNWINQDHRRRKLRAAERDEIMDALRSYVFSRCVHRFGHRLLQPEAGANARKGVLRFLNMLRQVEVNADESCGNLKKSICDMIRAVNPEIPYIPRVRGKRKYTQTAAMAEQVHRPEPAQAAAVSAQPRPRKPVQLEFVFSPDASPEFKKELMHALRTGKTVDPSRTKAPEAAAGTPQVIARAPAAETPAAPVQPDLFAEASLIAVPQQYSLRNGMVMTPTAEWNTAFIVGVYGSPVTNPNNWVSGQWSKDGFHVSNPDLNITNLK